MSAVGARRPRLCLLTALAALLAALGRCQGSLSTRVWPAVVPRAPPSAQAPVPSLLSCALRCLRAPAAGCAAVHHGGGWCRLYARAACDGDGGGLEYQQSPTDGRYVSVSLPAPRPVGDRCPGPRDGSDACERVCTPAAGGDGSWTLLGHRLPASVDVWTTRGTFGAVWKQITEQQCQLSIGATGQSLLALGFGPAADVSFLFVVFVFNDMVAISETVSASGASASELVDPQWPLLRPPELTSLWVSWCDGVLQVNVTRPEGGDPVTTSLPIGSPHAAVEFVNLQGYTNVWRLGRPLADPWTATEAGWTAQRVYTVPAKSALWRRVAAAPVPSWSVEFLCAGAAGCHVLFKETALTSALVHVVLDGNGTQVRLSADGQAVLPYPLRAAAAVDPLHFRWFRVTFDDGRVLAFDDGGDATGPRAVMNESLTELWAAVAADPAADSPPPPPAQVSCLGLASEQQPASYRVFEYDPQWGQESGYAAGAGLLTAEEGGALLTPTTATSTTTLPSP
ncbi:hypothetical protein FJT64_022061 [Amphibalanus amphitrite]|uniref:Farnesoic acid O-methyl transferase domain-containing protein n=1 Tax=Amphibalanus amphitrite TaxID=1232801 RepID=A0A6A4WFK6_AMPAM|nr:hypothetical protein FJT64_022061 [Amphibalanus amphitrite]